jgi:hypothetical protein
VLVDTEYFQPGECEVIELDDGEHIIDDFNGDVWHIDEFEGDQLQCWWSEMARVIKDDRAEVGNVSTTSYISQINYYTRTIEPPKPEPARPLSTLEEFIGVSR